MNGSRALEGYVPDVDATIVTRILEAGGRIVGKTHVEDLCCSAGLLTHSFCLFLMFFWNVGSHTNATGYVQNPRKTGFMAGGSSSGSAVVGKVLYFPFWLLVLMRIHLVANNEVEMAVGGDQGGSIRIPSAFCGTYGMKPTHGLVPYSGN